MSVHYQKVKGKWLWWISILYADEGFGHEDTRIPPKAMKVADSMGWYDGQCYQHEFAEGVTLLDWGY